ncbi:MAG: bacterioferritin [Candidatus Sericytochromatia bacterium]|nr:bacterioferritin [Candidatus Sericytochromatia bacterium]
MFEKEVDKKKVTELLNHILEMEMAGMVRYTHYSLMVYGYSRIPIVSWLREQANESMTHALEAGELITSLGGHPSLGIGPLLETHKHDIGDIMREAMEHEKNSIKAYRDLLTLVEGKSITLEEYARRLIHDEVVHATEVDKMLRKPGDLSSFDSNSH